MLQGTGDRTDEGADHGKEGEGQEIQNQRCQEPLAEGGRQEDRVASGVREGKQWSCYPRSESLFLK